MIHQWMGVENGVFIAVCHAQHPPGLDASDALGYNCLELTLTGPPMLGTSRGFHVTHIF